MQPEIVARVKYLLESLKLVASSVPGVWALSSPVMSMFPGIVRVTFRSRSMYRYCGEPSSSASSAVAYTGDRMESTIKMVTIDEK